MNTNKNRDSNGIFNYPQIQLILPCKFCNFKGSSEIPLISLNKKRLVNEYNFRLPLILQRELQMSGAGFSVEKSNVLTLPREESGELGWNIPYPVINIPFPAAEEIRRAVGEIVARTDKEQVSKRNMNFMKVILVNFQALKGILTAGGRKTIVYSLAKLKKMLKSMNKS